MISKKVKDSFPILQREINSSPLVYFDNAATTQSPNEVINAFVDYYSFHRANVHRGVHTLSEESTDMYESARKSVSKFIGCRDSEIVFVKNATEGANLVAFSYLPRNLKKGDTILISKHEHHSNLLPWLEAAKRLKLNIKMIPFTQNLTVDVAALKSMDFSFLAINQVSNFLGNVNDLSAICEVSKEKNARTFIDGAQGIPHINTNVTQIGCDFYTFSGHKIYAPFGTGALYIKKQHIEKMSEFMYGGGMISYVWEDRAEYLTTNEKYEAGTPNVGGAITLAAALDFFTKVGKKDIFAHEAEVLKYLYKCLSSDKDLIVYGPSDISKRAGLVSFNLKGVHGHDLASILDTYGVAVRSGQHCTIPSHKSLKVNSSVRASIAMYNFKEDVDVLIDAINRAKSVLL